MLSVDQVFVKANTCLQISLSSPWKIALDQSMTFHKNASEGVASSKIVYASGHGH